MRYLMLLLSLALAQTWAPVGTTWQYKVATIPFSPFQDSCVVEVIQLKVVKDTIFQGVNYKKVEQRYRQQVSYYYVYEQGGKIYYYDTSVNNFLLLYDFNVVPGSFWIRGIDDTVWVDWQDTIVVNGVALKALYVHEDDPVVMAYRNPIIENIGSWSFFFPINEYRRKCLNFFNYLGLSCYQDSVVGTWGNCIVLKREAKEFSNMDIWVYPNPFRDRIRVHTSGFYPVVVRLYDLHGQLLKEEIVQGKRLEWDLSFLSKGTYGLVVIDTNQNYRSFIIIKSQ